MKKLLNLNCIAGNWRKFLLDTILILEELLQLKAKKLLYVGLLYYQFIKPNTGIDVKGTLMNIKT